MVVPESKEATTTMPTINRLERRTLTWAPALTVPALSAGHSRDGWDAKVTTDDGTWHLSKLDGEARWTADGFVPAGTAMPRWMHGFGSRCTMGYAAPAGVDDLLDGAIR